MIRLFYALLMVLIGCSVVVATADAGTDGQVTSYSGEVSIDSKDGRVIVLVDTVDRNRRDGIVDQWFVLQAEEAMPPLAAHLEHAQIVHSAGSLRIVSHRQRVLFDLLLSGHQPSSDVPANFSATAIEGFGLAHYRGETTIRIPQMRRDGLTAFNCEECRLIDPD